MSWKFAGDEELARYFEMENVWKKKWTKVFGKLASVVAPDGRVVNLQVWSSEFNGVVKEFAADEVSSNVWLFALSNTENGGLGN